MPLHGTTPDATASVKGKVQLAGDLGGTAALPTVDGFAAWTTHTPQVDQGASANIAKTVNYSKYTQYGKTIIWTGKVTVSAGGTGAAAATLSLPVTAAAGFAAGLGAIWDNSLGTFHQGFAYLFSTTKMSVLVGATGNHWGVNPNPALAASDEFHWTMIYEAA